MVTIPEKEVFRKTLVTGCWAIALSSLQEPTLSTPFPRIPRHSFGNNRAARPCRTEDPQTRPHESDGDLEELGWENPLQ